MRARLFDTDRVEINISVNGAIPVKSDESGARKGMPDLDPTVEIGHISGCGTHQVLTHIYLETKATSTFRDSHRFEQYQTEQGSFLTYEKDRA